MENTVYQNKAIERFTDTEGFGLLWGCGVGKTRTAIKIAEAKEKKGLIDGVLIIAPATLLNTWKQAIREHSCDLSKSVFVWNSAKAGTKTFQKQFKEFLQKEN